MPNRRPIPKVDLTDVLQCDVIAVKPKGNELRIEIGGDRCRTIFLNQEEALSLLLTIMKGAIKLWGVSFMEQFVDHAEYL